MRDTIKAALQQLEGQGLRRAEIARRVGVHRSTVTRILSGERREPLYSTGVKVVRLLETGPR